jgi:hypothetical protein
VKLRNFHLLSICGLVAAAMLTASYSRAQNLTLEGQTGGFLTPTAYVVYSDPGKTFSHPAIGVHFIGASAVIGNIETLSITESFLGRGEAGYSRSIHQLGNETAGLDLSQLWHYNGMNIVHGKVVLIKDGQFAEWVPGIAVGGLVRIGDKFVSGAAGQQLAELQGISAAAKGYTNGDAYVAVTKTWAKKPVPFLLNLGWKATNATIFGIGGQSTRLGGRFFGGLGIPLPVGHGVVAVPSVGFTQEPKTAVNLNDLLNAARSGLLAQYPSLAPLFPVMSSHLPTTLDYAVRVTQIEHPHFAFDIGVGQVAGNIGSIYVPTGVASPPIAATPVNLQASHVVGMGLSYRY